MGDQIVAAKTVLPWLLQAAGTPGFFIALLVPIRESGSMLPQAAFTPWVTTQRSRKRIWVIGSLGQALAAAGEKAAAASAIREMPPSRLMVSLRIMAPLARPPPAAVALSPNEGAYAMLEPQITRSVLWYTRRTASATRP